MLRLFERPDWYVCVRKFGYSESALKAMKNDGGTDFKRRCSFFIEKVDSDSIADEVNKVKKNHQNANQLFKRKHIRRPDTDIRRLLDEYVSHGTLELMRDKMTQNFVADKTGRQSNILPSNILRKTPIINQYTYPMNSRNQYGTVDKPFDQHPWWTGIPNLNNGYNHVAGDTRNVLNKAGAYNGQQTLKYAAQTNPSTITNNLNTVLKSPVARLSDKIFHSSPRVSRLDSYTFSKSPQATVNAYSLLKGNYAFPAARYSRTERYYKRPVKSRKWYQVQVNSVSKKTEIFKIKNDTQTNKLHNDSKVVGGNPVKYVPSHTEPDTSSKHDSISSHGKSSRSKNR